MSEETRKTNVFEAFAQTQLTYIEAEEKARQEAGAPKVSRFRIGEDGEYVVRILPLAPNFDADGKIIPMERKGYEYVVRQIFLGIKVPSKKGKTKKINIPVIRTTDKGVGYSVDLIDTYLKIAKEMYGDDKALMDLITSNTYSGGLRWDYQHAMMVLDISSDKERAKGPQLWQCSHSQYKDIEDAKMRLWKELKEDEGQDTCPISGFINAYPVKVIRKTTNSKTEYTIEIGRKTSDISEDEAIKLLDLPRIPEQIYRYTRYQMEATAAFLQQYDEEHDMEVCKEPDFIDAVEKLKGELPADDNSHFDLSNAATKDNGKEEVTIDSLWDEYNSIVDQELGEKSDEYLDLREKIRQFIEDKGLDVRISRSKNNQQLLEEIEEALDSKSTEPKKAKEASKDEKTSRKPSNPEPDASEDEEKSDDAEEESKEEPAPEPVRRRRPRPTVEVEAEEEAEKPADKVEEETTAAEEAPRRRLHTRRMR